ncbi:hypothetical protein WR25_19625 [Diploscapter pachys]|uniref:MADF domain-containing protein n=1 Tax=Diploscapter pachys TaxID=2018661 RepID=A0A2A2JTJ0_9BILA|nr:hypothetical protein WR25_19625 [Diploscapter pachys]
MDFQKFIFPLISSSAYRIAEEIVEPTFNMRLIEAVRNARCLYDTTDRQYRNTEYKMKTWTRLVHNLGFDGDSRTLAARWKQLRDKYGKEKKKIRFTGENSNWQYFKHLGFLDPYMIDRSQSDSPTRKDNPDLQMILSDPTFAARLVEEVRAHPCLFDIRDPKYRLSECRNQAWSEIITHLNFPDDINAIYKQWKKIRDRYVREKRRIDMNRHIGVNDQSQWDLFDSMNWIDPFLDERQQHVKRKHETGDTLSDYDIDEIAGAPLGNYMVLDPKRQSLNSQRADDVLLDGDSAFAASAVSDLRSLPEHARILAKTQIETLLETGRMPITIQPY